MKQYDDLLHEIPDDVISRTVSNTFQTSVLINSMGGPVTCAHTLQHSEADRCLEDTVQPDPMCTTQTFASPICSGSSLQL